MQVATLHKQLRRKVLKLTYIYAHTRKCDGVSFCQQRYILYQRYASILAIFVQYNNKISIARLLTEDRKR